jgi:hypothetical protein
LAFCSQSASLTWVSAHQLPQLTAMFPTMQDMKHGTAVALNLLSVSLFSQSMQSVYAVILCSQSMQSVYAVSLCSQAMQSVYADYNINNIISYHYSII